MNIVRIWAPAEATGLPRREGHSWAGGMCDFADPGKCPEVLQPLCETRISIQTFPERSVAQSEHSQPLADWLMARLSWRGFLAVKVCARPSKCWTFLLCPHGQHPGLSRSKRVQFSTGIFYFSSICLSIFCTYWLALREGAVKYWPGVSSLESVMLLLCL